MAKASRKKQVEEPIDLVAMIDQYGLIMSKIEDLKEQAEPLAKQLKALVSGRADGKKFWTSVTQAERTSLDTKSIKAEMSPSWIEKHSRTTTVTSLNWGNQ